MRLFIFSFSMIFHIALFIFTVKGVGELYVSVVNKNAVNEKSDKRFEDFYALPADSLDIAFVGSSHSYCSFDPENFDSVLGTSSFQLGMPLQHPDATYYTIKEMYNYQKPKLVVVEVYWDLLSKNADIKQALTLFNSLNNEELEKEYVNEVFDIGNRLKYKLDIINYQKDYFAYKSDKIKDGLKERYDVTDEASKQTGEEYYKAKGYVYCNYVISPDEFGKGNQYNGFDGNNYAANTNQLRYLEKLVNLCRENGASVVFVTAPVANASLNKIENYSFVNKMVASIAESLNVPYIDYNIPEIRGSMFADENFRDDAHLNDSGVKILNKHFIGVLSKLNNGHSNIF